VPSHRAFDCIAEADVLAKVELCAGPFSAWHVALWRKSFDGRLSDINAGAGASGVNHFGKQTN
jgi:hypothetical protein